MPPQLDELLARVDQCSTQAIELSTHFQDLREQIRQAIDIAQRDPEMSLIRSRKVLEYIVVDIYDEALKPKRAGTQPLESLVQTLVKEGQFPNRLAAYADMVRGLGNVGAHGRDKAVSSQDVLNSLSNLLPIVEWFFEHRKMPGGEVSPLASAFSNGPAAASPSGQRIGSATDADQQPRGKSEQGSSAVKPAAQPAPAASKTSPPNGTRWPGVKLWAIGAVPVLLAACGIWYASHRHVAREVNTNSIGMKLTLIPAGEFMMGSPEGEAGAQPNEHPQHQVQITRPFYLGTYSVTRGQFARFVAATNYRTDAEKDGQGGTGYTREVKAPWDQRPEFTWRNTGYEQTDEHPVVNVSWNDAVAFCKWLSDQEGATYRLPTEAEWEYACRAGTTTAYFFGDNPRDLALYANTANATAKQNLPTFHPTLDAPVGFEFTAPVGSFRPNPLGLYDILGNAWQWCADWYGSGYYLELQSTDPQGPAAGSGHVMRGGSWVNSAARCRCSTRDFLSPATRSAHQVGFRVVRELGPPASSGRPLTPSAPSETSAKPPASGLPAAQPTSIPMVELPTITNSIGMKLTLIPAGDFLMGSPENEPGAIPDEHPQHRLRITKPFYIGTYSVTRGQFAKFVAATNYKTDAEKDGSGGYGYTGDAKSVMDRKPEFTWRNPGFAQTDDHPVVEVSWNDAVAFCNWLGQQEQKRYRLPTEAEWEYACRAGTTTAYFFGDNPEDLAKHANVPDATFKKQFPDRTAIMASDGYVFTAPVGSFRPNRFGLYDMLGNVSQWCSDWYGRQYYNNSPSADPPGAATGSGRVNRAGSWFNSPADCRCASRHYAPPALCYYHVGFRVVVEPESPATNTLPATTPPLSEPTAKMPTITNSIGMQLTLIPAGDFLMGSPDNEPGAKAEEHPQHLVRISKPFYIGTYSATRGQFAKFAAATNYQTDAEKNGKGGIGATGNVKVPFAHDPKFNWRNNGFDQTDEHPVVNVSWNDAVAFCRWLSQQEGKSYRLPTEAEWEYACRAGTTTAYFFGGSAQDLGKYAWYGGNSDGATHEVGLKRSNPFGLYDTLGNAWQWCSDWNGKDYYESSPPADPQGPRAGSGRVARGGCWDNTPALCRCSIRDNVEPAYCDYTIGFRVVREPDSPTPASAPENSPTPSDANSKLPTITDSTGIKLTLIPAGEFTMGSPAGEKSARDNEHPPHRVAITKPFYLGTYTVTRGQFSRFVAATSYKTDAETDGKGGWGFTQSAGTEALAQKPEFSWRNTGFPQTDEHPVVNVSWNDAVAFCQWLSAEEKKTYRLPTEAEWEYACRAGTTTAYYFGDDSRDITKYANVADATAKARFPSLTAITASDGFVFTAPVGSFRPNPFGLYDMLGNVWQWCSDSYATEYYNNSPPADPQGPAAAGADRVYRGGGYGNMPDKCRCACRWGISAAGRETDVGFRVVREP